MLTIIASPERSHRHGAEAILQGCTVSRRACARVTRVLDEASIAFERMIAAQEDEAVAVEEVDGLVPTLNPIP